MVYVICKALIVVLTLTVTVTARDRHWDDNAKIYFGYKDIGIGISDVKEVDTKSCTYSSIYGQIINWSENIYRGDGGKNIKIEYEILKSENKEVVDSYFLVSNGEDWKDVSGKWKYTWGAEQVYYKFEEDGVRKETWLVVYDEMILKLIVDNTNIYDDIIKKLSSRIALFYGELAELKDGVYYPAVDNEIIYADTSENTQNHILLEYDDKVYVSYITDYYTYDVSENVVPDMFEKELAKVYMTKSGHYCASYEKVENMNGMMKEVSIYKVKGYDEDFRVAMCMQDIFVDRLNTYQLIVFQCLNDVTLKMGREVFENKLHLSESVSLFGKEASSSDNYEIRMDYEIVKDFLEALNEGVFLSARYEEYPDLKMQRAYKLSFIDSNGLSNDLYLYPEGYVTMQNGDMEDFVVKVLPSACRQIENKILFGE